MGWGDGGVQKYWLKYWLLHFQTSFLVTHLGKLLDGSSTWTPTLRTRMEFQVPDFSLDQPQLLKPVENFFFSLFLLILLLKQNFQKLAISYTYDISD